MNIRIPHFIFVVAALAGCASAPDYVKKEIPVPPGQAQYIIPAAVMASSTDQELLRKYVEGVKGATAYRQVYRNANDITVGVKVEKIADGVRVGYLNNSSTAMYNDLYAVFSIKLSNVGKDPVLDVTCPTMLVQDNKNFIGQWRSFVTLDEAIADLHKICKDARIAFNMREAGEVNVNYGDSAVYANFARKLKAINWAKDEVKKDDIAKYRWFEVPDGNATRKLGITVYPYRNGSKVTYVWERDVICKPNTGCSYDPGSAKRISDTVAAIAND